jgi:hypothetical protein
MTEVTQDVARPAAVPVAEVSEEVKSGPMAAAETSEPTPYDQSRRRAHAPGQSHCQGHP